MLAFRRGVPAVLGKGVAQDLQALAAFVFANELKQHIRLDRRVDQPIGEDLDRGAARGGQFHQALHEEMQGGGGA